MSELIRDKYFPCLGSERETIRESDPSDHSDCAKGRVVEDRDLVRPGNGDIHAMKLGQRENPCGFGQASGSSSNLPSPGIEGEELTGIHVRDVQAAGAGIKALIIEAGGTSR
jgi:hypothetical protein